MKNISPLFLVISFFVLLFLMLPLLIAIPLAFSSAGNLIFPPPGLSLRWFSEFFQREDFVDGLRVSLTVATISTIIATVMAGAASYGLVRMHGQLKVLTDMFFNVSLLVPVLVIGVSILFFLSVVGVAGTLPGIIIGEVMLVLPLVIRTIVAAMENYNPNLEEAAAILGANPLQVFWEVVLPQVRIGLSGGAALAFVITVSDTTIGLFLRGPHAATLPTAMISYMRFRIDPMIGSSSIIFIVISIIILFVINKLIGFEAIVGMRRE
jgi:putative spermidine/putrescine transport system permease protein